MAQFVCTRGRRTRFQGTGVLRGCAGAPTRSQGTGVLRDSERNLELIGQRKEDGIKRQNTHTHTHTHTLDVRASHATYSELLIKLLIYVFLL